MPHEHSDAGDDAGDDISTLVLTLHDTERRLQKFVSRKVDALPAGDASWQAGILNALPANIALLDGYGYIVAVNDGWRRFAEANALDIPRFGIGANYLDLCDRAHGKDCAEAARVAEGIRAVLAGTTRKFTIEYPCHSPSETRWFQLKVTPLTDDGGDGAVVMHLNITERRRAESESRQLADRLTATLDSMSDAFFTLDRDWRFTFVNQQAEVLLHCGRAELLGRDIWAEFPTAVGSVFECEYRRAMTDNVTVAFEAFFGLLELRLSVRAYPSEQGLAVYFRDITETQRAAEALRASELEFAQGLRESERRIKRLNRVYAVLSQINTLIVRKPCRDELFREACRVAVELGEFRFAWIGLADRDAQLIEPVASAGGLQEFFRMAPPEAFRFHPGTTSRSALAIRDREPQVSNDFTQGPAPLLRAEMEAQGIHAYAIIPLIVRGEAIGVFALYAREAGFFDEEEMRLLQELAGNIALAIENIETQERLD